MKIGYLFYYLSYIIQYYGLYITYECEDTYMICLYICAKAAFTVPEGSQTFLGKDPAALRIYKCLGVSQHFKKRFSWFDSWRLLDQMLQTPGANAMRSGKARRDLITMYFVFYF